MTRTHGERSAIDDPLPDSDGTGTVVFVGRIRTHANMLTPRAPRLDIPSVCHPIRRKIMVPPPFEKPRRRVITIGPGTIAVWAFLAGVGVALAWIFMAVTPA